MTSPLPTCTITYLPESSVTKRHLEIMRATQDDGRAAFTVDIVYGKWERLSIFDTAFYNEALSTALSLQADFGAVIDRTHE